MVLLFAANAEVKDTAEPDGEAGAAAEAVVRGSVTAVLCAVVALGNVLAAADIGSIRLMAVTMANNHFFIKESSFHCGLRCTQFKFHTNKTTVHFA